MKKSNRKSRILILTMIVFLAGAGFTRLNDKHFEIVKSLDIFYSLFRELNLFYVDDPEPMELVETGINSMLNSLDPYTTFISESDMDDFNFMTTGNYGGIGSLIRQRDGQVIIADPYEGSPAAKAGLRPGDIILSVDGFKTKGADLSTVSEKLKGEPGTEVRLEVIKPGLEEVQTVKLQRERIQIKNVSYAGITPGGSGYIRLSNFTLGAGLEVEEAYRKLKNEKEMDKLILDLRSNPGGLLIEAVRVCNIFLDKGELIVSTKGRIKDWDQDYYTTQEGLDTEIPLVVLVNRGSASASEIVAGAFQDLDRAVVVGQRTFGKGLVQTTRKLKYNTQLKVTTAKYYIPSGRCIQAVDYAHRNEDGSVGNIPDSLISEFQTRNGRKVFDGGGITPDMVLNQENLSQVVIELYTQNLIFDFATQYLLEQPEEPENRVFKLTDEEYKNFIIFVSSRDFDYETESENKLKDLVATAKREKYYGLAEAEFEALKSRLIHDNEKDLMAFKSEINQLLNEEIAGRYFLQSGRIATSVSEDIEINKADSLLKDTERYHSVLNPGKKKSKLTSGEGIKDKNPVLL